MISPKKGLSIPPTQIPLLKVLVVDDDPDWLLSLTRSIEAEGHEVYRAASGSEAIGILQVATLDAVITDRHMPGRGEELIYYLQSRALFLPTLIVSGDPIQTKEKLPNWCSVKTKPLDSYQVVQWLREIREQGPLRDVA